MHKGEGFLRMLAASIILALVFVFCCSRIAVGEEYVVKPGDTLTVISRLTGNTVSQLVKLNNLRNPHRIRTGQRILFSGSDNPLRSCIEDEGEALLAAHHPGWRPGIFGDMWDVYVMSLNPGTYHRISKPGIEYIGVGNIAILAGWDEMVGYCREKSERIMKHADSMKSTQGSMNCAILLQTADPTIHIRDEAFEYWWDFQQKLCEEWMRRLNQDEGVAYRHYPPYVSR